MYRNDNWINSYLDIILDVGKGSSGGGGDRPSLLLRERGHFSPARYFIEEVITGYDETDLYKTWLRANTMRSPQERNTRLENMTWRIWNLARKKEAFGDHGIICLEDVMHEISTVGPHFREASGFHMPFKLKPPERRLQMKRKPFKDGGDSGNRADKISKLIEKLN